MSRNTSILAAIAFSVMVILGFSYSIRQDESSAKPVTTEYTSLEGNVAAVNPEQNEMTLETTSGTTTVKRTISISSGTRIEKVIKQIGAEGNVERQMIEEMNITDLKKGDDVTVVYIPSEDENAFRATSVLQEIRADVDEYIKRKEETNADTYLYLRSEAISVDPASRMVGFKLYTFSGLSTTTQIITLADETPLFSVPDQNMVPIVHARTAGSIEDLAPGDAFYVIVEKKGFDGTVENPAGIVIIKK